MFERLQAAWNTLRNYQAATGETALADPWRLYAGMGGLKPYNPSALVTRKGLKIFDEIRRDEQVKSAMLFKKHTVLASGWEVASPDGAPDDWEPTEFVRHQLTNLRGTLEETILNILTGLDYGYSVSEKVFKAISHGELYAGMVGLDAVKTKKPHSFDFRQDEYGNVTALLQTGPNGTNQLDIKKFVVMTYQGEFGNPYGTSDLDAAYRSWWKKSFTYNWLGMMLERYGIPPIFALYDPELDQATKNNLKNVLLNMQGATTGIIPRASKDQLELWSPQLAGQVSTVFIPALDRFDTDIAKALLMPGQLGISPEAAVGSQARARVVFDLFMFVVDFLRKTVEESIVNEQIVRPLVAMNFNVDEPPVFKLLPLTEDIQVDIMREWGTLTGLGVVQSTDDDERYIRNSLGFPEMDESKTPPDDTGDNPDDDLTPFRQYKLNREPVGAERRVDFAAITTKLNGLESSMVETGRVILAESLDMLIRSIERNEITDAYIRNLHKPPGTGGLTALYTNFLIMAMDSGQTEFRSEISKVDLKQFADTGPNFRPAEALKYLRTKGLNLKSTTDADLLAEIKRALLTGLGNGESTREIEARLRDAYEPWIGDPTKVRATPTGAAAIQPHRLEAIARTESTDSFNRGRLVEARRKELRRFMRGMRYSAILDTRTTEVCRSLDGKVFRMDDPALDRLRPPRHVNCRSILVPITVADTVNENEFITPSQAGSAGELSGKGFY